MLLKQEGFLTLNTNR